jgi:bacterioferritin-associated ferredoxin
MQLTMIIIRYNVLCMYVCICKGVTDSAIRREVRSGATSFREVRDRTGCATQCGKCACEARVVVANAVAEAHSAAGAPSLNAGNAASGVGFGFYEPGGALA